jgi:hypothetical protein
MDHAETLNTVTEILGVILILLLPVVIYLFISAFVRGFLKRPQRYTALLAIGFSWIAMGACFGGVSEMMTSAIRGHVKATLLKSEVSSTRVLIDGTPIDRPLLAVEALKLLDGHRAHHSGPTSGVDLLLEIGDERMHLRVAKDSDVPTEFWVFYPDLSHTKTNEIGSFRSESFSTLFSNSQTGSRTQKHTEMGVEAGGSHL